MNEIAEAYTLDGTTYNVTAGNHSVLIVEAGLGGVHHLQRKVKFVLRTLKRMHHAVP